MLSILPIVAPSRRRRSSRRSSARYSRSEWSTSCAPLMQTNRLHLQGHPSPSVLNDLFPEIPMHALVKFKKDVMVRYFTVLII